jgi:DNA primase
MTWWVAGVTHVTASYGVHGFTADHVAALTHGQARDAFIAYDADRAGDEAAATLADRLIGLGFTVYRVVFPAGEDANA